MLVTVAPPFLAPPVVITCVSGTAAVVGFVVAFSVVTQGALGGVRSLLVVISVCVVISSLMVIAGTTKMAGARLVYCTLQDCLSLKHAPVISRISRTRQG